MFYEYSTPKSCFYVSKTGKVKKLVIDLIVLVVVVVVVAKLAVEEEFSNANGSFKYFMNSLL